MTTSTPTPTQEQIDGVVSELRALGTDDDIYMEAANVIEALAARPKVEDRR